VEVTLVQVVRHYIARAFSGRVFPLLAADDVPVAPAIGTVRAERGREDVLLEAASAYEAASRRPPSVRSLYAGIATAPCMSRRWVRKTTALSACQP